MIHPQPRQGHTLALIAFNGKNELMVLPEGDFTKPSSIHYGLPMMELDSDNLMYCTNRLLGHLLGRKLDIRHTLRCVHREPPLPWQQEDVFCHPVRIMQDTDTLSDHAPSCYHAYTKPAFLPEGAIRQMLADEELTLDTMKILAALPDLLTLPESDHQAA